MNKILIRNPVLILVIFALSEFNNIFQRLRSLIDMYIYV